MVTEQDNLCYCILTLQYVKCHYVAGYLYNGKKGDQYSGLVPMFFNVNYTLAVAGTFFFLFSFFLFFLLFF